MVKYLLGLYGEYLGWGLLVAVLIYDPLMMGVRGFLDWEIAPAGYCLALLGAGLISLSKWAKRTF